MTTTTEPRRSGRVRSKPTNYVPSLTRFRYSFAVTQIEHTEVMNPDAHMFVQRDFYQADLDIASVIMTQLSLKAGMKAWGPKALTAVTSEMKQLHMRDTF